MLKRGNLELYVGVDESNHGRYPETFVAAFSNLSRDIQPSIPPIKKLLLKKRSHYRLFSMFSKRDFNFIQLTEEDIKTTNKKDLKGMIISSLLYPFTPFTEEHISIYIDGEMSFQNSKYIKYLIAEYCDLESPRVSIRSGPHYDQIYPIVNLADETAHYIFRSDLSGNKLNKHKVFLL